YPPAQGERMPGRGETGAVRRAVTYCVIPHDLAGKLHELLRRHFGDRREVEVIVEQRANDRRRVAERRASTDAPATDRRRIRAATGRRVADRRATAIALDPIAELPRKARPYAHLLAFTERLEPSTQQLEDVDTARLV